MTVDQLHRGLRAFAEKVEDERAHLTKLDSAIGDGDHGQNMTRGLSAAMDSLPSKTGVSDSLRAVAMAMISKTGGASGPLYGTFFMDAGKAAPDDGPLSVAEWASMLQAGLDGVKRRGKAETGEKTMVDALTPAIEALQNAADETAAWPDALQRAADAAREGMEATTPMVATKGRASYLGERSAGHQDPGATSTFYFFDAFSRTFEP